MILKNFLLIGSFLLAALSHSAEPSKEPKDFRGLRWGISVEEANRAIKEQWDKRQADGEILPHSSITDYSTSERTWQIDYSDKIGGVRNVIILHFLDGKLAGVLLTFESHSFDVMDGAFKARYGKPTTEYTAPLSNAFGATFQDQRRIWQFKDVKVALMKHASVKIGGGSIETRAWEKYQDEVKAKQKQKGGKDL